MLWIFCKHCLGDAVSLADHASMVLSIMVQAAEGRANNDLAHQLIDYTVRTLPWLPAYDRRDVLIVKHVLDRVAHKLHGVHTADNMDAVAFSVFMSAIMKPGGGDQVGANTSLESWFAEVKVPVAQYGAEGTHTGGKPELETSWLKHPPLMGASSSSKEQRAGRIRSFAASQQQLWALELRDLGWMLQTGASLQLACPAGRCLLPPDATISVSDSRMTVWEIAGLSTPPSAVAAWKAAAVKRLLIASCTYYSCSSLITIGILYEA
eukprot:1786311-Prymnesium_polylepis.1